MDKTIQIFSGSFSDGISYSLIINEEGNFETLVDNTIITQHKTLDEALEFIKVWSEEIISKSNHKK